jgi:hypothetical protein
MQQPANRPSLADAHLSGLLPALDRKRVRASLAFYDGSSPAAVREGLMLILQRVRQYLSCIDYAAPDRIVGRADRELPRALGREFTRRGDAGPWYMPPLRADQYADFDYLRENAAAMCFDVASRMAAYEIHQVVPEASVEYLERLARCWRPLLFRPSASGVKCWEVSRRRIGTKGACRVLDRLLSILPDCKIGLQGPGHAIIALPGESLAYMGDRVAWDLPRSQSAA